MSWTNLKLKILYLHLCLDVYLYKEAIQIGYLISELVRAWEITIEYNRTENY